MATHDIENVILFQLDRTNKMAKQHSQLAIDRQNMGITVEQWVLLKIIEESNELSQKDLAKKSLRDPASITRTLDILEKKKLIRREAIPQNRRQYNIILTAQGKEFVNQNMELIKELRKQSVNGFTLKELDILRSFLLRMQENMS
ncbi:MAG: MarR family transcriptional regulator [Owenweeksia sp.]